MNSSIRRRRIGTSVLEYLLETVQRTPATLAIREGVSSLTFETLVRRAVAVANRIPATLTHRRSPVLILQEKSADAIVGMLAALVTGNCYCPVDVRQPAARLQKVVENLQPIAVIASRQTLDFLAEVTVGEIPIILVDAVDTDVSALDAIQRIMATCNVVSDLDPAYIIYTSGSTGIPKGVAIPHRGIFDYIEWAQDHFVLAPGDVIASQAPLYFDNSTLDLYLCFATGATLLLVPETEYRFPAALIDTLERERVSFLFWVPSALMSVAKFDLLVNRPLPALRYVVFAGEVMPPRPLAYWMRQVPHAVFYNLYGPTEITVDCTWYRVEAPPADDQDVPIGLACRNTDVLILTDDNRPAGTTEIGELCVRGSSLALGYWNAPEQTAKAFVQNPLESRIPERIYRTGDLVYRDALQQIHYVGRKDHQVKLHGYRIELGEVEAAIGRHERVTRVCVIVDPTTERLLAAYEADHEVPATEFRAMLAAQIPKYMIPSTFIHVATLPQTPNGKLDRRALATQLTSPTGGTV